MVYGVEVPAKSAAGKSSTTKDVAPDAASGYTVGDDDDDGEGQLPVVFEPLTVDDYVYRKLSAWAEEITTNAIQTLSIAIVSPYADNKEVLALALEALVAPNIYYRLGIMVNVPAVHHGYLLLQPKDVLYYILRELKRAKAAGSQKQASDQGEWEEKDPDPWQDYSKKCRISRSKKRMIRKIKSNAAKMNIYKKLEKIKSDIKCGQQKNAEAAGASATKEGCGSDQAKNKAVDMYKLPEWNDNIIMKIALRFKKYMEADEKTKDLDEQIVLEEEATKQGGERSDEKEKDEGEKGDGEEEEKDEERNDKEKGGGDDRKEDEHEKQKLKNMKEKDSKEEHNAERNKREGRKEEQVGEKEDEEIERDDNGSGDDEPNKEIDDDEEEEEEEEEEEYISHLHEDQYAQIIREVFPNTANSKAQQQDKSAGKQAIKTTANALDEERIKQMINEAILRELLGGKPDKNQGTCELDVPPDKNQATSEHASILGQNLEAYFEEIEHKIEEIRLSLREQLKIKGIVDKIKHILQGQCPLIILKVDEMMEGSRWEEIRKALSLLECSADALIFTTESTEEAKGYCYPQREPIDCSLVGLYHYMVLELTRGKQNKDNYNPQIFRDILDECLGHEFSMKIFTHALYANPKRSNEELSKLHNALQNSVRSWDAIAKKMFMYSYNDLPKEYKSCLLYLAIFPKGQKVRRSTLIGRWVTEGLTFKEDWTSSVRQANRCFDALIRRWLVCPADIGATGKVKSCVVDDIVHGFITTIARKQHIVETRLSHHLARHFSIFNDLCLRSSDRIDTFFQSLSQSSRVSMLRVLHLEGCHCFGGKNQRYLKDICIKMLLLKYLSLRGTDITQLPTEMNYLRELEVLDIRETKVPKNATINVLLLKLKRLLAGHMDPSPRDFGTSVWIPKRIDKMVNIEVLSNVKAQHRDDLEDIGKLWQLRKLGVVIDDKKSHLGNLLKAISDLHECLHSVSITIVATTTDSTHLSQGLPDDIASRLKHPPEILESLSINGAMHLFPLLTKGGNNKLSKVTLSSSPLNQDGLNILARLPNLQCVRLQHISCAESVLIFKEYDFECLRYLLIEGTNLTNITFEDGAACQLEKLVLSSTSIESISGVDVPPNFKELELNNNNCRNLLSSFHDAKQIIKLTFCGTFLKQDDLQTLAKKLHICCLELLENSFEISQNQITFEKEEFLWLNLLIVDCSTITKIDFTSGSAPWLQKIVWSSSTSLFGIENLPGLKELEYKGHPVQKEVKEAIEKSNKWINLKYTYNEP
uniref:NB-ARC domain-containing protein n=1 Tax=Leersia perrieri TaxID=77586 RepID=A0A0D9VQC6_9ORYZ